MVKQHGSQVLGFTGPTGLALLAAGETGAVLVMKTELPLVEVTWQEGVVDLLPLQQVGAGRV